MTAIATTTATRTNRLVMCGVYVDHFNPLTSECTFGYQAQRSDAARGCQHRDIVPLRAGRTIASSIRTRHWIRNPLGPRISEKEVNNMAAKKKAAKKK